MSCWNRTCGAELTEDNCDNPSDKETHRSSYPLQTGQFPSYGRASRQAQENACPAKTDWAHFLRSTAERYERRTDRWVSSRSSPWKAASRAAAASRWLGESHSAPLIADSTCESLSEAAGRSSSRHTAARWGRSRSAISQRKEALKRGNSRTRRHSLRPMADCSWSWIGFHGL